MRYGGAGARDLFKFLLANRILAGGGLGKGEILVTADPCGKAIQCILHRKVKLVLFEPFIACKIEALILGVHVELVAPNANI